MEKQKRKSVNYINTHDFRQAFIKHYEEVEKAKLENKPEPKLPDYIGKCFLQIANNITKKYNFNRYSLTWKENMISESVYNMIAYYRNYDPYNLKQNPFGYFSKYAFNACLREIEKEKKYHYTKCKLADSFVNKLSDDEMDELQNLSEEMETPLLYDNLYDSIEKFETKQKEKKLKKEQKIKYSANSLATLF